MATGSWTGKIHSERDCNLFKKNPLIHPDSKMAIHSFQHEAKKGLLLNEVLSNWETTDHHLERLAVHPLS